MGAAPKPDARRPNRGLGAGAHVRLPASGRQGPPPTWPLDKPSVRERQLWERVWATPPAVAWERLGWADAVARYVRILVQAEKRETTQVALTEARQMEDRLGLNPMSLLRLRWEIVDDEPAEEGPNVLNVRERLKAIES